MEAEEMDINPEEESLLGHSPPRRTKGGLKTMPFIIVNEAFERVASQGLMPNMILYLTRIYHFQTVTASSILFIWSALSNGLASLVLFCQILIWVGSGSFFLDPSPAFLE
nr:protein NRT1/ PTR FAMILY 1.2-like isoform X2 [Coffea arabica]